jgi:hypothetical protein
MISDEEKALQMPRALFRTRTGDPFLTIDGPPSGPVTPGPNVSPNGAAQPTRGDPAGPPKRPQDAPRKGLLALVDTSTVNAGGRFTAADFNSAASGLERELGLPTGSLPRAALDLRPAESS